MNAQSPQKVLLAFAAVALFSESRALAQNQAAAVAVVDQQAAGMASAVASAVTRSGAAQAQQDQIREEASAAQMAAEARGASARRASIGYEKPEDVHFSFKPPATTRRPGHPGDRDIKLTEKQIEELNWIGEALVDFVDSRYRVETNENAKVDAMLKERDRATSEAAKAFADAQKHREEAQIAVLDVSEKLKVAKADEADRQKEFDEAQGKLNELKVAMEKEVSDLDAFNQAREKMEKALAEAATEADGAAARFQKGKEKEKEIETALGKAKDDFSAATNAMSKATADAEKAGESLKAAQGKVAEAKEVIKAKERDLDAAEDARDDAAKAVFGAAKDVAAAEGALVDAERELRKAERALDKAGRVRTAKDADAAKARGDVAKAKDAKAAADKALEAARPANPEEKQGFWARRALRKAEKRARRAQSAIDAAEAAVLKANKAFAAAGKAVEDAQNVVGEKKAAIEKKRSAIEEKKDALEGKKSVLGEKVAALAVAGKAVEDAKEGLKTAKGGEKGAEKKLAGFQDEIVKQRKASERANSDIAAFSEKASGAKKEGEALDEAKKEAEEKSRKLRERLEEIDKETDKEHKANLLHEDEKTAFEDSASKALDALELAKGKVTEIEKLDTPEIHAALDKAREDESQAGDAYRKALAAQNRVAADARVAAQRDEKELEAKNERDRKDFWDLFREEQMMSAADEPNKAMAGAAQTLEKAQAAEQDAIDKAGAAVAALATAKDALAAAENALDAAKDKVRATSKAAAAAAKAAADAAKAAEGAAEGEAKDAAIAKKTEADNAKAESDKAKADAETAFAEAEKAAIAAKDALAQATAMKNDAEGAVKGAKKELAQAKDATAVAGKSVAGARAETDRAVDVLVRAFDEQIEETRRRKLAAIGWQLMDANARERQKARDARKNYHEARKAYAVSRKTLAAQRRRYENKEIQWDTQEYVVARADYSEKRAAFEAAEDEYNKYFSDSHTFHTAQITDVETDGCYETEEALRALHGVQFRGDRRWLARASVNGEPLLDTFLGEMEWQAEELAGRGEAERDPADPSRVKLTPEQAAECAEAAAKTVQRRAIYGGFYFAGFSVTLEDGVPVCFVDKGRFGPITVVFVDREGNSLDTGRIYNETNILAKLGSKAGDTNAVDAVREGEAFNFIEFRKNFNALNANPDIDKADTEFRPVEGFDYGFESEDAEIGARRTTRAIAANVTVREKPWPAPVHGVVSIDNFNSMGAPDKPLGAADTYMARLTLQGLDLWDAGHALTANGNYSLGGSLYGGAASYYIPREELSWADGSWRRLSGWSWTLHGGYTDVDQNLKEINSELDVLGTGYYGGLQASSRMVDFDESALDLSLGFTWRYVENSVRINGEEIPLGPNGDGYTIMPLSVALMYSEKSLDAWRGRTYATLEAVYNLGGSSADDLAAFRSAIDDDRYLLLRAQLARLNLLWEDSYAFLAPRLLFLKADAQYASTPLIGAEQYGLGGHGTIRGYVEREFMGDSGASGTIEFRTPIGLGWIDRTNPNAYQSNDRLQFVYFVDLGYFMLEDGTANKDGQRENDSEFIYSVGVGLRYSWKDFVFRFDWGVPLVKGDRVQDSDERTFETSSAGVGHLSLQYQF